MNKTSSIDFMDFSFKGKNLSNFGWYVGGNDKGIKSYSVLPSRTRTTDYSIGQDGETVYSSRLEPRAFEVCIFNENLKDGDIRKLGAWLDSPTPQKFYYIGDDVYCMACLDSQAFDCENFGMVAGQLPLKFIAYDPYYYKLTPTTKTITNLTSGTMYTFENNSTGEIFPFIQVGCSGTLKIEVYDENDELLSTTNITDITGGVKLFCDTQDATLLSTAPHFQYVDTFPIFPESGNFKMKFTGSGLTNAVVEYTEKFK